MTQSNSHIRTDAKSCIIWVITLSIFLPLNLKSQTCCSGGVPLGNSLGTGTAEQRSLQVLATYDHNFINDFVDISTLIDDDSRSRTTQSSIIELNYGISRRFSVAAVIPYIRQTRNIKGFNGSENVTTTNGIGDPMLLIKYQIIKSSFSSDIEWVAGIGPKIPLGWTDHTNDLGLTLAADLQSGSGSWDGLVYSYLRRNKLFTPNLSFLGQTVYRYTGTNFNYNETQAYRFGNEFQASLGLSYNLFARWPIQTFGHIRYRHQTEDFIDGFVFPGSGGEWIYLIPGINVSFTPNTSIGISGDFPIYRKLKGTQLTTSRKFSVALYLNIPTKKSIANSINN